MENNKYVEEVNLTLTQLIQTEKRVKGHSGGK